MCKTKIIATDKVQKIECLTTGLKEYTMFYNAIAKKNNALYDLYILNEKSIQYYEALVEIKPLLYKNLTVLYEIREDLIELHIEICNTMDQLIK